MEFDSEDAPTCFYLVASPWAKTADINALSETIETTQSTN